MIDPSSVLAQQYVEDHGRPPLYLHGLKPKLSFMLSGKHLTYMYTHALIHTYRKHNSNNRYTEADIRIFMNSYTNLIHILVLLAYLYLFKSHVGVIEHMLILRYP